MFEDGEITTRNMGFVTEEEQARLRGAVVGDAVAGKRSRMPCVPIVITTVRSICYEVVNAVLGRPNDSDNCGYFFNADRTKRPKPAIFAAMMRPVVRKVLNGLTE